LGLTSRNGASRLIETAFNKTVEETLRTPKVIQDSMDWRDGAHPDYAACDLAVFAPQMPHLRLRLSMTAHVRKLPRKCTFQLIFGSRIFALDVNPARTHNNRTASLKVDKTHWQTWPCEVAEPDRRDMIHVQWFNEFLTRAHITFLGRYERPPYMAEQLEMM
jgi:hypothetical protein